jgi:hypothetical protein
MNNLDKCKIKLNKIKIRNFLHKNDNFVFYNLFYRVVKFVLIFK